VKFLPRFVLTFFFPILLLTITGCLSTEYKEYRFQINSDGSGKGSIVFHNIVSVEDDEKDVSYKDFGELLSDYLEGTKFEDDNPAYKIINKELYEDEGVLAAKVEFTFDDFRKIGFYKEETCDCSPIMYYMGRFSETYSESNGKYLGNESDFPMIVWKSDTNEMYIKTIVQEDLSNAHSLLNLYNDWKEKQK